MENPFDIVVYNKDLEFEGFVANPIYAHFVPSWEDQGYGSFMLADDNPHSAALQEPGARVTVAYRGRDLMSGRIQSRRGDLGTNASVTYQVLDDKCMLEETYAWVAPASPLAAATLTSLAQAWRPNGGTGVAGSVTGQSGYYEWPALASAETAIKHIIQVNLLERLGHPISIAADLGRGGDPTSVLPRMRFAPISEVMTPLTKFSGLGVSLRQPHRGNSIVVDTVTPGSWPQVLTQESGVIKGGSYSVEGPAATRAIVGGPGETAARVFHGILGSGRITPREQEWGRIIEVFRDATGASLEWPENLEEQYKVAKYYHLRAAAQDAAELASYLAEEHTKALDEGAPKTGLSMELAETETFHFGGEEGVQLGDYVTADINGVPFTEQIRECMLTFTRETGLVVTPIVGERTDDPDLALAKSIADLSRALRRLSFSK